MFFDIFQNLSGTIVAIINIITVWISPNPRTAAIYYFITALFILLACFDTYFALPLNVRFFSSDKKVNYYSQNVIFDANLISTCIVE
jgi:equilibrative nucleoside transporter 1/2/3